LVQMKKCKPELEYMHEKRKDVSRTKIRDHFAQIKSLINDLELKFLSELERQSASESNRLNVLFAEIDSVKQNIKNDLK